VVLKKIISRQSLLAITASGKRVGLKSNLGNCRNMGEWVYNYWKVKKK